MAFLGVTCLKVLLEPTYLMALLGYACLMPLLGQAYLVAFMDRPVK